MGIEDEIEKIHKKMVDELQKLVETSVTQEDHKKAVSGLQLRVDMLNGQLLAEKAKVAERDDRLIDMAARNNAHVARIAELERQLALRS